MNAPTLAVYAFRAVEVALVAIGVVLVVGGVLGGMNVLATAMLALLALFGMAVAACLEVLATRPIQRRWGGEANQ